MPVPARWPVYRFRAIAAYAPTPEAGGRGRFEIVLAAENVVVYARGMGTDVSMPASSPATGSSMAGLYASRAGKPPVATGPHSRGVTRSRDLSWRTMACR